MSFTVVNKRDRKFKWENGFDPYGYNLPKPEIADQGKVLSVDNSGSYALAASSAVDDTVYFNLRLNTTSSVLTVTDTTYTVAQINNIAYSYVCPVVLKVQYDEDDIYRLFRLYRIEESGHLTKWCNTVSTDNTGVIVFNDLINLNDNGTLTFYRRAVHDLTAGDNISISDAGVISAVLPTTSKTLLWAQNNLIITDGWNYTSSGVASADWQDYDEIIVEIMPTPNEAAGNDALSKGGCYIDATHSVNKHVIGRKTAIPESYTELYPENIYVFDNLSIYSPTVGDANTNVHYNVTFYISTDNDGYKYLNGICNSSSITATLWANCMIACFGIKHN